MTLRLLGPQGRVPPMSQLMAFVASHFRRLITVWTLFGPMPHLYTDLAFALCLVLQDFGVCHRASLEGSQHLGMPYIFPSLPLLGLGFLLLFSVIKVLVDIWTISSKEAAGSCCCSCCNLILTSDAHWDRNLSFKITCPS